MKWNWIFTYTLNFAPFVLCLCVEGFPPHTPNPPPLKYLIQLASVVRQPSSRRLSWASSHCLRWSPLPLMYGPLWPLLKMTRWQGMMSGIWRRQTKEEFIPEEADVQLLQMLCKHISTRKRSPALMSYLFLERYNYLGCLFFLFLLCFVLLLLLLLF